jgi:hypothetical protein
MKTFMRISLVALPLLVVGAEPTTSPDRVGFPSGYPANFRLLGVHNDTKSPEIWTTYGNDLAAAITRDEQLPFPDGAVLLMEFAGAVKDAKGEYLRDAAGRLVKGEILRVDVMRRGDDFGAVYGESRAGEWEFASYNPDGTTRISPDKATHCAACHRKVGAEKDFVHRLRPAAPAP